jgi:hypothetical protein
MTYRVRGWARAAGLLALLALAPLSAQPAGARGAGDQAEALAGCADRLSLIHI